MTNDDFDYGRNMSEEDLEKLEDVEVQWMCKKCRKVTGSPRGRTTGGITEIYCKKCFRELFHPYTK